MLNVTEVRRMVESMAEVAAQGATPTSARRQGEGLVEQLLGEKEHLSLEDFLVWTVDNTLPKEFARLVFQLCHVVLGLRTGSRREEGEVVRGWLAREEQAGLVPGQVWYLLPMAWWTGWHAFVNWSEAPCSSGSLGRRRRAGQALSSSLASDSSPRVVATGYSPLAHSDSRPSTPGSGDSSVRCSPSLLPSSPCACPARRCPHTRSVSRSGGARSPAADRKSVV